jgi:hypothetical protein
VNNIPKYKKKSPSYIEAKQYNCGSEDGFSCYELSGKWIGWFEKGEPLPRTNMRPYIYDSSGEPSEYQLGDYLATLENRSHIWIKKAEFECDYELLED